VVANEYIGWVEEHACAYCQNYTEWTELQKDNDFVMVTKDTTLEKENVSLYMGTKIYFSQSDN